MKPSPSETNGARSREMRARPIPNALTAKANMTRPLCRRYANITPRQPSEEPDPHQHDQDPTDVEERQPRPPDELAHARCRLWTKEPRILFDRLVRQRLKT